MTDSMGIRELSDRTDVSPHALRYYERAGLMIDVPRDDRGRRAYGDEHVRWVAFLRRLRDAGMGISQIREYAELVRADGAASRSRRLEILRAHRDEVRDRLARLSEHLEVLDRKVADGCAPDGT
ncbi:MAG: MerR family transcriptional regulator [Gemmatimonadota bacterium]|nr:MerR family transcriptional regulator [Gemmatimonadota bacterium]